MSEGLGRLRGPVKVVGAGLLGTSIGLALSRVGFEVLLADEVADHVRTASGLGAGRATVDTDEPQLVVVAVPPDHLGAAIRSALDEAAPYAAIVTDVGSIKRRPLAAVADHPGVERYVGGHPIAGSERSGPLAASAALFDGRPWAVTPHDATPAAAVELVEELARWCGAVPIRFTPSEHDHAVARTSHVPHLMASLAAGRLADASSRYLLLTGQGLRDVTRVAAGDPSLYGQIIASNSEAVLPLMLEVRDRVDALIAAVDASDQPALKRLLAEGVEGTRAIPGKHGGLATPTGSVFVSLSDEPGGLARLFADAAASDVNIEDVRIDHDPGRRVGLVEVVVDAERVHHLLMSLRARGWVTRTSS